ncbi:MAG: SUMF1/EgtB/PvdO family nonheme iron enzyme [Polyangiales bacterium]
MNRRTLVTLALTATLSAALTGLVVHTVRAVGIPTMPAMFYRGTLDPAAPGTVTRTFRVALYGAASGGSELCPMSDTMVTVTNGAFEVPLPAECTNAIRVTPPDPGVWLELTIDRTTTLTPRTKLGAVPYAVEAERAVNATAATGALDTRIAALEARLNTQATQVAALMTANATLTTQLNAATDANPDCPRGYTRDATITAYTVCTRTVTLGTAAIRDDVVKVGSGVAAFWIDRFEASVYDSAGTPFGTGTSEVYPGLPKNGQWYPTLTQAPLRALSVAGRLPSANITWFQANEACRAGGKRLPLGDEWLAAASGTVDTDTNCWINPSNTAARMTNAAGSCRSAWGAQDMIGNLWEWTAEWFAGAGNTAFVPEASNWPTTTGNDYRSDATRNVNGFVSNGVSGIAALPSAALRGGYWYDGTRAGVFSLNLNGGPSDWSSAVGFRCVLPR